MSIDDIEQRLQSLSIFGADDYFALLLGSSQLREIAGALDSYGPEKQALISKTEAFFETPAKEGDADGLRKWALAIDTIRQGMIWDIQSGRLASIRTRYQGDVLRDLIAISRECESHKDIAAVLACAALETAMRRLAENCGASAISGLSSAANYLRSVGKITKEERRFLDPFVDLRDSALHSDWGKVTPSMVASLLGYLEQFVAAHFGK